MYKMLSSQMGADNDLGTQVRNYAEGEVVETTDEPWREDLMKVFVENGWAKEVKTVKVPEKKTVPEKK